MNKISKIFSLVCLGLILSISLSACRIPFTDIEIFSKKDEGGEVVEEPAEKEEEANDPEEIIAQMTKNMLEVSSYRDSNYLDMIITADFGGMMLSDIGGGMDDETEAPDSVTLSYTDEGDFVKKSEEKANTSRKIKVEWDQGDMIMRAGVDFKEIDDVFYLQVTTMPTILKMFLGDDMENKWFKIEEPSMDEEEDDSLPNPMMPDLSFMSDEDSELKELLEEVEEYIKTNDPFKFKEELPEAKVKEVDTYHYKVELDKEFIDGMEDIIIEFAKKEIIKEEEETKEFYEEMGMDMPESEMSVEESIEEMEKVMKQLDKIFVKSDMELWIGKEDMLLYRTNLDMTIDMSTITPPEGEEKAEVKIDITGDVNTYDFNEDIIIEVPEDAQSIEEYFEEKMGAMFGGMEMTGGEMMGEDMMIESMGVDTDNDGLEDSLESLFETDPNNPDTDGDGLLDGEEMETYYTDPLEADSDGDGYSDGDEVEGGYNPNGDGKLIM